MRSAKQKDFVQLPVPVPDCSETDLDKQSINYATVFNMNTDLHLTGLDFSWVVTIFYFGQMAGTFLSAYFISRFHVVRVVGITTYGYFAAFSGLFASE